MEPPVRRKTSALSRESSLSRVNVGPTTELVSSNGQVVTVAEKIDEIGFGFYQLQVFVLCAGVVVSEACFLQTAAGLASSVAQEFNIDWDFGKAAQMLSAYVGFALGTLSSGTLGDVFGRRWPIALGYLGMLVCAGLLCFAANYALLCLGFFSLGYFAGVGIPAAFIVVAEVSPTQVRGVTTAAMAVAFCSGEFWSAAGFRLLLPDLVGERWRAMILWAMIPPTLMLCFGLLSPVTRFDTPPFLGIRSRSTDLVGVMNLIAAMNGKQDCTMNIETEVPVDKEDEIGLAKALTMLTRGRQLLFVAVFCVLFFVKDLAFYGMGLFWPLAWRESKGMPGIYPAMELLLTSSLGFPGVAVAMIFMFILPRRLAFAASALLCGLGCFAVHGILDDELALGLTGVVTFKLFYATTQMTTFILPSEVFSTQVRVWGLSIVAFSGRLATLAAPIIINKSRHSFLFLTTSLLISCTALVWVLPETKDRELLNSFSEVEGKSLLSKKDCESQYGSASSSSKEGEKAAVAG